VEITPQQASRIYASEADVLNVAMFGMTALNSSLPLRNTPTFHPERLLL
jgi:hypothetical protein